MSLNLWKIGGQPTSYNPLPLGYSNQVSLKGIFPFVLKLKAKSVSGATLFVQLNDGSQFFSTKILTSNLREYEFEYSPNKTVLLMLGDLNAKGDIIIEDIQLVQKPLPTLTINGIDGFKSGKWTLHANARVIDDETLELNATGNNQISFIYQQVKPNQEYSIKFEGYGFLYVDTRTPNDTIIQTKVSNREGVYKFTTESNASQVRISFYNENLGAGKFTFRKPMLNLGSAPAPYEKKRGTDSKMVLPTVKKNLFNKTTAIQGKYITNDGTIWSSGISSVSDFIEIKPNADYVGVSLRNDSGNGVAGVVYYNASKQVIGFNNTSSNFKTPSNCYFVRLTVFDIEKAQLEQSTYATPYEPYAVQVNKKPMRYVPKKNLFDGVLELGSYATANGSLFNSTTQVRNKNLIEVLSGKQYTLKPEITLDTNLYFFDLSKAFISAVTVPLGGAITFTTPSNCKYFAFRYNSTDTTIKTQLEEGSTPTPYEPYQLILPRAKSGLRFEGDSYVQLPSMTMDGIEIDCLIDASVGSGNVVLDARVGLANGWLLGDGSIGSSFSSVTGFKKSERTKVLIKAPSSFTDDVTIFARGSTGSSNTKGTLYGITCYLNGNIVAQYDAQSIVGDKLLQGVSRNLIPSFEDSRWSLHANADVLGKDVLRLEASSSHQISTFKAEVTPNTNYLLSNVGNGLVSVHSDDNTVNISPYTANSVRTFNSGNRSKININLSNFATTSGTFDFIQSKLFQLDGKEGTLVGKPTPLRKASKRTLYRKR
jgi:hypothetical protein